MENYCEDWLRDHSFRSMCTIGGRLCSFTFDPSRNVNLISSVVVEKLKLQTSGNNCMVSFSIGNIADQVWCDIADMDECHFLLGTSWQLDTDATFDEQYNGYSLWFKCNRYHLLSSRPCMTEEQFESVCRARQGYQESMEEFEKQGCRHPGDFVDIFAGKNEIVRTKFQCSTSFDIGDFFPIFEEHCVTPLEPTTVKSDKVYEDPFLCNFEDFLLSTQSLYDINIKFMYLGRHASCQREYFSEGLKYTVPRLLSKLRGRIYSHEGKLLQSKEKFEEVANEDSSSRSNFFEPGES